MNNVIRIIIGSPTLYHYQDGKGNLQFKWIIIGPGELVALITQARGVWSELEEEKEKEEIEKQSERWREEENDCSQILRKQRNGRAWKGCLLKGSRDMPGRGGLGRT